MDSGENVLEEAQRITSGDRARDYGPALDGARRWAQIASAAAGVRLDPEDFPAIMIAVKLSRVRHNQYHRDTWVDIAGYARVAELIQLDRQQELLDEGESF